jgi:hypothetical protein
VDEHERGIKLVIGDLVRKSSTMAHGAAKILPPMPGIHGRPLGDGYFYRDFMEFITITAYYIYLKRPSWFELY